MKTVGKIALGVLCVWVAAEIFTVQRDNYLIRKKAI